MVVHACTHTHTHTHTVLHLDEAGVTHDLLRLHHVYQRFLQSHIPDTAHVKAIDTIPPYRGTRWSMSPPLSTYTPTPEYKVQITTHTSLSQTHSCSQYIFSSLYFRSSMAVRYRQALSGNSSPPGFWERYRSHIHKELHCRTVATWEVIFIAAVIR